MEKFMRARRRTVELNDLPMRSRIAVIANGILLEVFAWLFVFLTVASLISSCVLTVLVMYKVYCGEYQNAVVLCVVLVTMVLMNILIEPPQRKV